MIFPSKPFLQRRLPDFFNKNGILTVENKTLENGSGRTRNAVELRAATNRIDKILDAKAIGMKINEDEATSWYWILTGLTITILFSWLLVILLRFIAGFLFWLFKVGVIGILSYRIRHCYKEYSNLQGWPNSYLTMYDIGIQTDLNMYFQMQQSWLAFSEWILKIIFVKVIIMEENRFCLKEIWVHVMFQLQEKIKSI